MEIGIVWFRQDLRLSDNPALHAACQSCDVVVPLFIDDPNEHTLSQLGAASRVWLHHSLGALNESLNAFDNSLRIAQGNSLDVLNEVSSQVKATRLFWNRCYDPASIKRDKKIKQQLVHLKPESFNALLIDEPWNTCKADATPYRVYTPYWNMRSQSLPGDKPLAKPRQIPDVNKSVSKKLLIGCTLDSLALLPRRDWHIAMMSHWQVGEKAASKQLAKFLKGDVSDYSDARNLPWVKGTSRMSPHLHFGEISPRQIMHKLCSKARNMRELSSNEETFAKEIIWREFAYSLLFHFPHTLTKPLDKRFTDFPWAKNHTKQLRAWQRGQTGVPIVDAGMRELYATGWMHNRVRMIVASYLIKNLLIPWQKGERWFRDTLVDADLASNAMGWQWAAGSGADAAPYFRIFNPVLQGEKFDANGEYVKKWVPELMQLEKKFIHKPWELPAEVRAELDYPDPLVDLKESRQRALSAFESIKQSTV